MANNVMDSGTYEINFISRFWATKEILDLPEWGEAARLEFSDPKLAENQAW